MQPQMGPNEACVVEPLAPDPRDRQSPLTLSFATNVSFEAHKGVTSACSFPSFQVMLRPLFKDGCDCTMRMETGLTTMVDLDTRPACEVGINMARSCVLGCNGLERNRLES